MEPQPDVLAAVRRDLADWRQWVSRTIVLAGAVAAGLAVVGFVWLSGEALDAFDALRRGHRWLPLVWTPAVTAAIAWITLRWLPGAAGSGIPQVMAALSPAVPSAERGLFVSLRLSVGKALLTPLGLLAGLAIGREGPAAQIAAGVLQHVERWLPRRTSVTPHGLIVAGGAAGIAAAFNAPLAGVMFAIEELARNLEQRNSGLLVTAIVLGGLVAVAAFGNASYFGVIRVPTLGIDYLLPGLAATVGCGLLGGFFSRLLHVSIVGGADRFSAWRRAHPVVFAAACGLVIAIIGLVSGGSTFGSGYDYTRRLVEGETHVPLLYVTLRLIATWLAVWSGVPGGIFAPTLAIGAGVGNDVALFFHLDAASAPLIAIGMTALLAAVTQAPLTAFIIVMEMVDGHAMVLSLMAAALGASLVSRWLARPLYVALAEAQLRRLKVPPAPSAADAVHY
jgi:H+/Cl- antiporter ClcA